MRLIRPQLGASGAIQSGKNVGKRLQIFLTNGVPFVTRRRVPCQSLSVDSPLFGGETVNLRSRNGVYQIITRRFLNAPCTRQRSAQAGDWMIWPEHSVEEDMTTKLKRCQKIDKYVDELDTYILLETRTH